MSPTSTSPTPRKRQIASELQLDQFLESYDSLNKLVVEAGAVRQATIREAMEPVRRAADEAFEAAVGNAPAELLEIQEKLTSFLVQRRPILIRRLKKVIKRPAGEVKFVEKAPEMEWPKDESGVIKLIENRQDGLKYLVYKPSLNKKAIREGPAELLLALRHEGVWLGKHLHVSLQTTSMAKSLELVKRRINHRPLRKK
jgi:hypothetical protein